MGSPAASNWGSGPCYLQWRPREIPAQAGVWVEAECSRRSLGTRRSCGVTRGRLRCGGAVWPWRRRGLCAAEQGEGVLGLWWRL
jgi:hypothetical protein